ncbi:peptidase, partial [Bacillus mobilis]
DLLDWFLDYDFKAQRRKSLLKYRVIKFFPILKRKVGTKLSRMFAQNN